MIIIIIIKEKKNLLARINAGILGGFTTMHYIDPNTFNLTSLMANPSAAAFEDIKVEKRPYFLEQQGNATTLDDGFNTLLNSIVGQLNNVQKPSSQLSNDDPLVLNYTATIAQILSTLPYGAIFVDEIPPTGNAGVFSYTIQAGTNQKLAYTSVETSTDGGSSAIPPSAFPSEGLRRIYFHSQLVQQFSMKIRLFFFFFFLVVVVKSKPNCSQKL